MVSHLVSGFTAVSVRSKNAIDVAVPNNFGFILSFVEIRTENECYSLTAQLSSLA